ncbi:hypothetical protein [Roseateles sp. LYH14W]|uniref:Uncharacterized protein n=1 Tax=Pelomonas parva TaxID=3299032 RepID=A0ABW7EVM3_9BURK
MAQTVLYLGNIAQRIDEMQASQQLGPDSRFIGEAGVAVIINPAQITNTGDLHRVLRTLEQAILTDMDVLDAAGQKPGVFQAALEGGAQ